MVMPVINGGNASTPPAVAKDSKAPAPPQNNAIAPKPAEAAPSQNETAKPTPEGDKPSTEAPAAVETKEQKEARLSRAARAARRNAAKNRELTARTQHLEQQVQSVGERAQLGEQQIRQLQELAKTDPYAAAKVLGLDMSRLAEGAVRENTPEAQLEARIQAAERRAAQAEERLTARERAEQATAQEQARKATFDAFQSDAGDATAFPTIAKMPPSARLAWAQQIVTEDRAQAKARMSPEEFQRYQPTNRQVLQYMEKLAASNGAPPQAPTVSSPDESKDGSAITPTTVTAALASAKYTLPTNFDKLSDREQKWHSARLLESLGVGKKKKA